MNMLLDPLRTPIAALKPIPRTGWAFRLTVPFGSTLAVFVALLLFVRLGHRELYSSHEARAAQNAQRMIDTGEWGLPVLFDGQVDLQKPPGFYWLVAIVGRVTGGEVNAWVTRAPAALAGLLTVLMVYGFLKREDRPIAAMVATLTLATAVHFTAIARIARIDVPLTCAVSASLLAFYRGWVSDRPLRWHLLSAVAAAAAILLKGPVGLALIGSTAMAALLASRTPPHSRRWVFRGLPLMSVILGTGVLCVLALPWFLWASEVTNGEFIRVFFWHHNFARFAGTSATLATHPWWYYGPRFTTAFLPWSPALVLFLGWALRKGQWRADTVFRFGLVWFVAMFTLLSTAKFKRADYLLPAFPGAAIALGCAVESWLATRANPRTVRLARWGFGSTVGLVAIGWLVMSYVVEPTEQAHEEKQAFATVIREQAPPPNRVLLFRAESHLLAFHLGRPLYTLVEWMELNDLLAEPGPHFVVMPPEYVYAAQQILTSRKLVLIARLEDYTPAKPPRPLVFLQTED